MPSLADALLHHYRPLVGNVLQGVSVDLALNEQGVPPLNPDKHDATSYKAKGSVLAHSVPSVSPPGSGWRAARRAVTAATVSA